MKFIVNMEEVVSEIFEVEKNFVGHLHKLFSAVFVLAREVFIVAILMLKAKEGEERDMFPVILATAVYKVLPNGKTDFVAVVIPTERL